MNITLQNQKTNLSSRESEIFTFVTRGLSSKEIAQRLGITINTVYTHRQTILRKVREKNSKALAL